jgi:hypothetical protein
MNGLDEEKGKDPNVSSSEENCDRKGCVWNGSDRNVDENARLEAANGNDEIVDEKSDSGSAEKKESNEDLAVEKEASIKLLKTSSNADSGEDLCCGLQRFAVLEKMDGGCCHLTS